MKKIRLDPEALVVESFDVADVSAEGGTVYARQTSVEEPCSGDYCVPSHEAPCWWTGDRMQDCLGASMDIVPCTDYRC
jgi:hypothetical protein